MSHHSQGRLGRKVDLSRRRAREAEGSPFSDLLDPRRVRRVIEQEDAAIRACTWSLTLTVDSVFRRRQRRACDFRRGRQLAKYDHVVQWRKPSWRPEWTDCETYSQLPDSIAVREVKVTVKTPGFRVKTLVVATTLTDSESVTSDDLADAYRARWHAELDLRSIKSTMEMDVLRCKSPSMVRKEIWTALLAYNLIRTVMADAAEMRQIAPRQVSFAGAIQTARAFRDMVALADRDDWPRLYRAMLQAIGRHRVGDRPNRYEPRAIKRRPKPHALLTVPRREARCRVAQRT